MFQDILPKSCFSIKRETRLNQISLCHEKETCDGRSDENPQSLTQLTCSVTENSKILLIKDTLEWGLKDHYQNDGWLQEWFQRVFHHFYSFESSQTVLRCNESYFWDQVFFLSCWIGELFTHFIVFKLKNIQKTFGLPLCFLHHSSTTCYIFYPALQHP